MADSKLYRVYIDEVGEHSMKNFRTISQRYLTLFGVIFERSYMKNVVQPEFNALKMKYFQSDPDEAVCIHRAEMVRKKPPYDCLADPKVEAAVLRDFCAGYARWDFAAITVTIDKEEHIRKYGEWHYEPYNYCLTALVERFVHIMEAKKVQGDVMIETRNGSADRLLSAHFNHLYESGTDFVSSKQFKACLTSRRLKLKSKEANVCGLQLADLMASAAHFDLLFRNKRIDEQDSVAGQAIAKILNDSKYHRNWLGKIEGYGRKLLPSPKK